MNPKKVLLVSPNTETVPMPVYPLSLARLAGALEQKGHRTLQFDVLVHGLETLPGVLREFEPDLVALSLRNVDNLDVTGCRTFLGGYREVIGVVRAHSRAPVILGGGGFSLFPREFLGQLQADGGVVGPGEGVLENLLSPWEGGQSEIPALIQGRGYPSACPFPCRSRHDPELVAYYWQKGGMIGLQTKRGCTKHCSYCTYPLIDGDRLELADISTIVGEIELLKREHGVTYYYFVDSLFNQDRTHELALAEELIRQELSIKWCAFFAPAGLDREYLATLQQSGLTHLEFGTEALSDRILATYRKGFTTAEVLDSARLANDQGLHTCHYLLFGGPAETPETMRETLDNTRQLKDTVFFPFVGVRLYPGTQIYQQALAEGMIKGAEECLEPVFYSPPGITLEEIWRLLQETIGDRRTWLFPSGYEEMGRIIHRLRRRGLKGPLWEYLLRNQ